MPSTKAITTIAIDAMGGDLGPSVTVPAAIDFLNNDLSRTHKVILVGLEDQIIPLISQHSGDRHLSDGTLATHPATQIVEMDEAPAHALKRKKDSSMRVTINLVKQGVAQAAVSAGNTGALMATAKFVLKTIKGIDRPAIISTLPCLAEGKTTHMLDLGANVDSSPEMLIQFAVMGAVLTQYADNKTNPTIALLNVGAEEIKGSEKVKKASALMSETNLNYVGFIEGDEIYNSKVDVIVCDGFEGNVALKTSEGTVKMILKSLKEEFTRNFFTKFLGLMCKPVLKAMQKRLDPRRHNGATLIGLNGIVVKSHGGTDRLGFLTAIEEARKQADMDVIGHISEEIVKVFNKN